jgi:hypothetical protein
MTIQTRSQSRGSVLAPVKRIQTKVKKTKTKVQDDQYDVLDEESKDTICIPNKSSIFESIQTIIQPEVLVKGADECGIQDKVKETCTFGIQTESKGVVDFGSQTFVKATNDIGIQTEVNMEASRNKIVAIHYKAEFDKLLPLYTKLREREALLCRDLNAMQKRMQHADHMERCRAYERGTIMEILKDIDPKTLDKIEALLLSRRAAN